MGFNVYTPRSNQVFRSIYPSSIFSRVLMIDRQLQLAASALLGFVHEFHQLHE